MSIDRSMMDGRVPVKRLAGLTFMLALAAGLVVGEQARAQTIERLVMPGPLVEDHADLEDDCSNCHAVFGNVAQRALCLDCHKDVHTDLKTGEGFHSRIDDVLLRECAECHADHKGRDADVVQLNVGTFDHALTDFPLRDLHVGLSCGSCHLDDEPWREAPSTCISCHRSDDTHDGTLGEVCAKCHTELGWVQAKTGFNHQRETGFALIGGHEPLACDACHLDERYENTPESCVDCHAIDDVHQGRLGQDCADCHQPASWTKIGFNHAVDTDFPLTGKHQALGCHRCHVEPPRVAKPLKTCISCHEDDDSHRGRNGTDCQSCHTTESWQTADFDHLAETGFGLIGGHQPLACEACHTGDKAAQRGATCHDCHGKDEPHEGALGRDCASCHNETNWFDTPRFDHDLTSFPLLGQHTVQACTDCHVSSAFKGTDRQCIACHADDDVHERNLGTACGRCHNPNDWALWQFDHGHETDFQLIGAHDGLQCAACHQAPVADPTNLPSDECGDCHRRDDIHRGAFGDNCGTCHNNNSFREVSIRR